MARQSQYTASTVPSLQGDPAAATVYRDIDLRALTPIYKGSAKQDGVDEAYPFRGPALRGQLRLWWRATRETTSVQELRADENLLFGGVHQSMRASRVSVGLYDMKSRPARKNELAHSINTDLNYALWVDRGGDDPVYHVDARARLRVSGAALSDKDEPSPELLASITPALRAMVLFGGSGSRSRRGLGSLWSTELLGEHFRDIEALAALIEPLCPSQRQRSWPSLAGVRIAWAPGDYANAAMAVNAALNGFRELRGMKSTGGRNFTGEHRMALAQRDWLNIKDGKDLGEAFTAALGMPLIYRSSNKHLDGTTVVTPDGRKSDRLPSPVHVRPIPLPNGKYAGVILALRPWYQGRIVGENRRMRRTQRGTLNPNAVALLVDELGRRGWKTRSIGGEA